MVLAHLMVKIVVQIQQSETFCPNLSLFDRLLEPKFFVKPKIFAMFKIALHAIRLLLGQTDASHI